VRFDLAEERQGGAAGGRGGLVLVVWGESGGMMEGADVVEGDV
jgi:hypothetical protein